MKTYIDYVDQVVSGDAVVIKTKDADYKGSWLKRGGIGAWMMAARKWDRLEEQVERRNGCDVLVAALADTRPEGVIDDIRDLRRYLVLIEAEILARGEAIR